MVERRIGKRQGLEAENSPVVPLVEAEVREVREEGGGSEKETRMRQEMEGLREVQESLAPEEAQVEALESKEEIG